MRSFFRTIVFAFQGIARNFWLSVVTTSVCFLTLVTVNAVIILNVIAIASIQSVENRVHVDIYLKSGTTPAMEGSIRGYLTGLEPVKEVILIPADEALKDFKARHSNDPDVLAALDEIGENPLGDALRVSARSPKDFPFILQAVNTPEFSPHIKETGQTNYDDVVASLTNLNTKVRYGGTGLAIFFGLIAILMVYNTVRVAVYVHRDEIAVMRLVGAQGWFISAPFLLEAVIFSAVATGAMAGLLYFLLKIWEPFLKVFFTGVNLDLLGFYIHNGLPLFVLQFVALSLLGMASSAAALRKYSKI
jgi:cell division transport system permease protein